MSFLAVLNAGSHGQVELGPAREARVDLTQALRSTSGCFAAFKLTQMAQVARLQLSTNSEYIGIGRVRLDRRDELLQLLSLTYRQLDAGSSDIELVLYAYVLWGETAAEQIHGDFALVIWDEGQRTLHCVRDRVGIRTLAYLERNGAYWVSDAMSDLLEGSGFEARQLDRSWIADFLRIGWCNDPSRTVYADVKRLAPAHRLMLMPGRASPQIRCYWRLEPDAPLFLRSSGEYLEMFHSLLANSIRDRLPRGDVGIQLSGGLDSTALAAKTVEVRGGPDQIAARTWTIRGHEDPEEHFSCLASQHLGIRHDVVASDLLQFNPEWRDVYSLQPEPQWSAVYPGQRQRDVEEMARVAKVWFFGEGPDNALLFEWKAYLRWLAREHQWMRLGEATARYALSKSWQEWLLSAKSRLRSNQASALASFEPVWVKDEGSELRQIDMASSWRPRALNGLRGGQWPYFLEVLDADHSAVDIEWCHPYLETQLLEFMLRTPPIPWGRGKMLIRKAMRERLPAAILKRPKTPLHFDIIEEQLRHKPPVLPRRDSQTAEYVAIDRLPEDPSSVIDTHALLRVSILDQWLSSLHS